jgi:hypothetical protein
MGLVEFTWPAADDFRSEVMVGVRIVNGRVVSLIGGAARRRKNSRAMHAPERDSKDNSQYGD